MPQIPHLREPVVPTSMKAIVYQDGIRVIAVGPTYGEVKYGISRRVDSTDSELILTQDEARELAAALTWIISEVDARNGRESFKPVHDKRRMPR